MLDDSLGQQSLPYHRALAAPAMGRLLLAATAVAVGSAPVCVGWLPLGMFNAFTVAAALQGAMVGCGMRWAIRSSRVRRRSVGRAATLLAGVAAGVALYAALYVRAILLIRQYTGGWPGLSGVKLPGLVGVMQLVPWPALAHLVLTPWTAWLVARREWSGARCPSCGQRLPTPRNAAVVSTAATFELIGAIVAGDSTAVLGVVTASANADLAGRCVVARAYRCGGCGDRSVDVVAKTFGADDRVTLSLLPPTVVTEAVDDALRGVANTFPPLRLA
jgi:hypothetical protein